MAALGAAAAAGTHLLLPAVPVPTAAVVLGIVAAHLPGLRERLRGSACPGLGTATRRLMRAGVVLLGLRLTLGDVVAVGGRPRSW